MTNQVQFLTIISFLFLIISSLSLTIPVTHHPNGYYFGVFKYPGNLVNTRQLLKHSLPSSPSLMASINYEDNLVQRENECIDLDDEPTPELDRALSLTLAGKLLSSNRTSIPNLTFFAARQWECQYRLKVYDGDIKGKGILGSKGKRTLAISSAKGVETPKPKRGRPSTNTSKNV